MSANISDLKHMAEDLEYAIDFYISIGGGEAISKLAAMLARVQDKIDQFEAANDLLDDAEELLEKFDEWKDTDIPPMT